MVVTSFSSHLSSWFAYPSLLWLLLLLPMLGISACLAARWRQKRLAQFGNVFVLRAASTVHPTRRKLRGVCLVLGLTLLIAGMAGPRWGFVADYQTATGRDIVLVFDLSRSMLAEAPSRQQRAKAMLRRVCDWAETRGGHRLGLVMFAGRAQVVCPLTNDYHHVRKMLDRLDAADVPPDVRPRSGAEPSGTRIGAALQLAAKLHDVRFQGSQDILLMSDGDDPSRDREWLAGIDTARQFAIAVDVVGVGDLENPKWIPRGSGYLEYNDKVVETRLEEKPLRSVAQQTGGVYIPAQTRTLPLGELYQEVLNERKLRRDQEDSSFPIRRQHYVWFLTPALVLLALTVILGDGRKNR